MSTNENTSLALSADDLMSPAAMPTVDQKYAGAGAEELGQSDIILPRISLLQGLSKPVVDDVPGAKAGLFWTFPFNRPASLKAEVGMKFVVVRIYPVQRQWTPLDQGGGLVCEAPNGNLLARSPEGLAGAKLKPDLDKKNGAVKSIEWEGGEPTANCLECVFGPAAAAAAAGKEPTGRGNPWLPKIITVDGKQYRVPDELRAPRCTGGLDALILAALPAFKDEETGMELAAEVIPAFLSFNRTSQGAGRSLAGMIKMATREPAWGKIFTISTKKVQNDKGTFFVPVVTQYGYSNDQLATMARDLYESTSDKSYVPDMSEMANDHVAPSSDVVDAEVPSDDEPAPGDEF